MRALVVCVNYDDFLRITLPQNIKFFDEVVVITSPQDRRTVDLVSNFSNARCFVTDAFYRHGASFNKGLAIEECYDFMGRTGWMVNLDADIILPYKIVAPVDKQVLYGVRRRILKNPAHYRKDMNWRKARRRNDRIICGYFQLFHATADVLKVRPWVGTESIHAGHYDHYFQDHWPKEKRVFLPIDVLHLGPVDTNWFGRASPRLDKVVVPQADERKAKMDQFLRFKGWAGRPRSNAPYNEFINRGGTDEVVE